ncbi:tetratricopeptide repeat protein [Snodgrassella alvi]|uniref:tetratricopeptide repeat protein n=2 Tax=Snodgrassella alvi TaxID=1196083 RepID=UPI00351C1A68
MEEKDIEQQIEELNKITREDGNENYAQAQVKLGDIYRRIKHDYDQAEAFYLNITKEDNSKVYAQAQFGLGYIYQEIKHDYDQTEAFYLNINKENNPEVYAKAQFNLGNLYCEIKHDYDQAKAFYLNINKEDNPEAYVLAQYSLGNLYRETKHDFDQTKAFYLNIYKEDDPEIYAKAQFSLGYIYQEIKHDYDQAEAFYLNIYKEDNPEIYAKAQFSLGYIYQEIKHDYDQAEAFYLNIYKEDNPEIYAKAQFSLGDIYQEIKHDYDQAEAFYLNIYKEDNPEAYALAQFFLGWIYQEVKHDYDQAEAFYFKITKENNPEIYTLAQDGLGEIYTRKIKKETQATDCFLLASKIERYSNRYPYQYICAQLVLGLKQNNFNHVFNKDEFKKLKDFIYNEIENICKLTSVIKNILFVSNVLDNNKYSEKEPERRVAHYTKPSVLFNLLKGENPSKFRLNIVDFMNDPSENQILTSWLNISNNPDNEIKSFLASFSFNHNSLNQFRLYGNENNIVGSGVSIAFNKNFFGLDTERSINNEIISLHSIKSIKSFENKQVKLETEQIKIKSANTLYPLPLYRCLYFDPETGYMALAKRNKQSFYLENKNEKKPEIIDSEWDDYIGTLDEPIKISYIRNNLKKIKNLIEELSNNPELKKISNLGELLSLAVLPISCLIKHAAFEDEDECRMIYITHIADDNIVEPQDYQSANSLYVEYTHVEEYIDNIYLGPQCKMQHKIWLQNHFKKKRREREIKLIKSEMPLR